MASRSKQLVVLGVVILAYFVLYPGDLAALFYPVERLLALSQAVYPGLYAVVSVGLLCWTTIRIWGPRSRGVAGRDVPPPS